MSKAVVLDAKMDRSGEVTLPDSYAEINPQNVFLYIKSYQASIRANGAMAKNRAMIRGGGKKPWSQKGGGRARAGTLSSPLFVGGGKAHGPMNNRNYDQKVNKKQKTLALKRALFNKAESGALFVVDTVKVESGKTKDAAAQISKLGAKNCLIAVNELDEKTFLAYRNLPNVYLAAPNELNAFTVTAFNVLLVEKAVLETIMKEG